MLHNLRKLLHQNSYLNPLIHFQQIREEIISFSLRPEDCLCRTVSIWDATTQNDTIRGKYSRSQSKHIETAPHDIQEEDEKTCFVQL